MKTLRIVTAQRPWLLLENPILVCSIAAVPGKAHTRGYPYYAHVSMQRVLFSLISVPWGSGSPNGKRNVRGRVPHIPWEINTFTPLFAPARQRRGNYLGGRVGSCPPNYNIGWAANVFCPPKKISQHISSRPNYTPIILALVDSISDSRSLCALCSISQLVTSVNYLKNFLLIKTKCQEFFQSTES